MEEDDGSSPDSSPKREPQFTPNQPHVPVTAPYFEQTVLPLLIYQVINILGKLTDSYSRKWLIWFLLFARAHMWRRPRLMEPIARSTSQCLQPHLAHRGIQGHESRLSLPVPLFPCNIACITRSFAWCAPVIVLPVSRGYRGVVRCHPPPLFRSSA